MVEGWGLGKVKGLASETRAGPGAIVVTHNDVMSITGSLPRNRLLMKS